jgi:hypothetical protein
LGRLSDRRLLSGGAGLDDFDINAPPRGAWFDPTVTGWTLGATTRSPMAFFLVPFMCVWSGGSLGGIYGSQIFTGEFNLLLSLFGIPFLLGTVLLGSLAVMTVCGKVNVQVDHNDGTVFTGVGPIGWTRRFEWSSITAVEETQMAYQQTGSGGLVIVLISDQSRVKFGSMLSEPRRYYLLQGLRRLLAERDDRTPRR